MNSFPRIKATLFTILAILLGTLPRTSFSKIATGYSLESLTLSNQNIAVYRAYEVSSSATEHEGWLRAKIKTKCIQQLKGKSPKSYETEFNYSEKYDFPQIRQGAQILVFDPQGEWPYRVRLDGTRGGDGNWRPAITSNFRVLSDTDSIMNLVKSTVAMEKGADPSTCGLVHVTEWAPDSTEAFKELWSLSAVIMHTTMQPRHKQDLLSIADHGKGLPRAQAVQILARCFPEVDTNPMLQKMLTDVGAQEWWTGETLYPARQFAYEELKKKGQTPSTPFEYRIEYAGAFTLDQINSLSMERDLRAFPRPHCERQLENDEFAFEEPDSFFALGAEGKVHLNLDVARDGSVIGVDVAGVEIDTPPKGVADPLVRSARGWKFKPVTIHGIPRRATVVVPVMTEGHSGPFVLSKKKPPYFAGKPNAYDEPPQILEMGAHPWGWKLAAGGTCEIEANVDSSGQVLRAKMIRSKGVVVEENLSGTSRSFEEEYLQAVTLWKFSPVAVRGVPKPAVIRIPLEVPRARLVVESAGFHRFFPGARENPDGPLELLEASVPEDVNPWPGWSFSVIVKIDETGKVLDAYLPSRRLMRPLVEQVVSAAHKLKFNTLGAGNEVCSVSLSKYFRLPSYTHGSGLFRKESGTR